MFLYSNGLIHQINTTNFMDKQIRNFNNQIRELLDLLAAELPNNSLVADIHRKFQVALMSDRTLIITETGQELFNYRDVIVEDRWDELINKDWEQEIQNRNPDILEDINNNSLKQMIMLLRNIWSNYSDEEKDHVKKLLKKLLSTYVKYLKLK